MNINIGDFVVTDGYICKVTKHIKDEGYPYKGIIAGNVRWTVIPRITHSLNLTHIIKETDYININYSQFYKEALIWLASTI